MFVFRFEESRLKIDRIDPKTFERSLSRDYHIIDNIVQETIKNINIQNYNHD